MVDRNYNGPHIGYTPAYAMPVRQFAEPTPAVVRDHALEFHPLSATIGAEVAGLRLNEPLSSEIRQGILAALARYKVLFFRDQELSTERFRDVAAAFGHLECATADVETYARDGVGRRRDVPEVIAVRYGHDQVAHENYWHFDVTAEATPSAGTMLRAREVPEVGGDTLFADMAAAYEDLGDALKARLDGLVGLHDFVPARRVLRAQGTSPDLLEAWYRAVPPFEYPIVSVHTRSGCKTLFVNEPYTVGIKGMNDAEAAPLLRLLSHRAQVPEYQCRFRWRPGSIALWDNLACQHYAVRDYWPQTRSMERVTFLSFH
jgi:taurine dioxygenase